MDLTNSLQFYRKRQGLSQIELAEALEVSRQTVSKWETGAALPSAENLAALGKLYGLAVDQLLNGPAEDEPVLLPADPPPAPPSPGSALPLRQKLLPRMLAAVFLFDLVMFLLQFYVENLAGAENSLCSLLRVLGCCLIGLIFARRDRDRALDRKRSLLVGLAALVTGLYMFLLPAPLLWRLYDLVAWIGSADPMAPLPSNPLFFFLGWTLFDQYTFATHMFLAAAFYLGRLPLTRKSTPSQAADLT